MFQSYSRFVTPSFLYCPLFLLIFTAAFLTLPLLPYLLSLLFSISFFPTHSLLCYKIYSCSLNLWLHLWFPHFFDPLHQTLPSPISSFWSDILIPYFPTLFFVSGSFLHQYHISLILALFLLSSLHWNNICDFHLHTHYHHFSSLETQYMPLRNLFLNCPYYSLIRILSIFLILSVFGFVDHKITHIRLDIVFISEYTSSTWSDHSLQLSSSYYHHLPTHPHTLLSLSFALLFMP